MMAEAVESPEGSVGDLEPSSATYQPVVIWAPADLLALGTGSKRDMENAGL